jgi:hypothetical protein
MPSVKTTRNADDRLDAHEFPCAAVAAVKEAFTPAQLTAFRREIFGTKARAARATATNRTSWDRWESGEVPMDLRTTRFLMALPEADLHFRLVARFHVEQQIYARNPEIWTEDDRARIFFARVLRVVYTASLEDDVEAFRLALLDVADEVVMRASVIDRWRKEHPHRHRGFSRRVIDADTPGEAFAQVPAEVLMRSQQKARPTASKRRGRAR